MEIGTATVKIVPDFTEFEGLRGIEKIVTRHYIYDEQGRVEHETETTYFRPAS